MEDITLLDLANEIGVTKSAINQKLTKEDKEKYLVKVGNKYVVNEVGVKAIKGMFNSKNTPKKTASKNDKLIDSLMQSNNEQLKEKDKQIAKLQSLLDQQQQLSLNDKKRIETLERQLVLEPPKEVKEDNEETRRAIFERDERIKELELQVEEDERINAELYEAWEKLNRKKWYQFWKK
ncbi:hypothetical protein HMPREF0345_2686 [Enterococcus faecalis ATCC 29200]|uniref:DUF536 domain-containing protein n=1 Tax=Enterococcus faecalis TaxID=1351 RepID=UPI00019F6B9F|nr:DUF536 domain-containing protein [Enterococcus faecalis]EEN70390.1 hypothetical protein HMPREF0345_2686 [Enterococcus faecalis ATCC 29200]EOJ04710.1 hypothetical protein UMK_02936 [Enterococcus faecalis ATCC 29200]HDT7989502.1 DUF536 domain-containing protein [Enterococcus faecalis]HDT8070282.1 DUF536 domain-containing protein [Enterococcus faecalis]